MIFVISNIPNLWAVKGQRDERKKYNRFLESLVIKHVWLLAIAVFLEVIV